MARYSYCIMDCFVAPFCFDCRSYGVVSMCIGTGMGAAAVFEYPGNWCKKSVFFLFLRYSFRLHIIWFDFELYLTLACVNVTPWMVWSYIFESIFIFFLLVQVCIFAYFCGVFLFVFLPWIDRGRYWLLVLIYIYWHSICRRCVWDLVVTTLLNIKP